MNYLYADVVALFAIGVDLVSGWDCPQIVTGEKSDIAHRCEERFATTFASSTSASFALKLWIGGSHSMAKFGLKEGSSILEIFEADTVVVHPPHKTAVFYSGLDEWRETARIHLKPGQTIETDQSRLPQ